MALFLAPPSPYTYRHVVGERATYAFRYEVRSSGTREVKNARIVVRALSIAKDGTARFAFSERSEPEETVVLDRYGRLARGRIWGGYEPLVLAFSLPPTRLATDAWTVFPDGLGALVSDVTIEGRILKREPDRVVILARSKNPGKDQTISRETTFDTRRGRLLSAKIRIGAAEGPRIELDLIRDPRPPRR